MGLAKGAIAGALVAGLILAIAKGPNAAADMIKKEINKKPARDRLAIAWRVARGNL